MKMTLVTDYLEKTAEHIPDKLAFGDVNREITFGRLRDEAYRLASMLIRRNLFRCPILVFLDKSINCIATFMGVAYSGNFYTVVDPTMPQSRVKKIVDVLRPKCVITEDKYTKIISDITETECIVYDSIYEAASDESLIRSVRSKIIDTDLLYVLFTSGSTGVPKGVTISHRAVIDYTEWVNDAFRIDSKDVFANQAPFFFDNSVLDIYQTIKSGATMHIVPENLFSFPIRLLEYMQEHNITTIFWVPSALCLIANLRAVPAQHVDSLKKILFAGEVMPNKQLNIWRREYPDALFANLYGPTEITVDCSYYIVDRIFADDEPLPIGKSRSNADVILLNDEDKVPKEGEIGEICVRGSCLSYGYYNQFEQTKKVFVQNPLNSNYLEIIYRTGDLAHYNDFGELIYDGRKDFQIKHHGHRIELGEIETAASALKLVMRNCCLYDDERKKIILFYEGDLAEHDVMEKLEKRLPNYMVPDRCLRVEDIPLNLNGKINRLELRKRYDAENNK